MTHETCIGAAKTIELLHDRTASDTHRLLLVLCKQRGGFSLQLAWTAIFIPIPQCPLRLQMK